jgi:hypothetical protein
MAWGDLSHPYFRFAYDGSRGVQGAKEAHSFICSPRELEEEQKDEDGGYG